MSSSSSNSLPPSLKKINVFLKRAEELDRDKSNPESRVVAYNCRQYAVLQGIPLAKKNASTDNGSANKALGQLLDTLETEKHAMSVFSKNEHWKICRKVADRVFDKADSEDRAGVANKGTARSFYAAGTFYEILQQFHNEEIVNKMNNDNADAAEVVVDNDVDEDEASVMEHLEEENQRRIYCKWKATDILNAIKEGRSPTPGGYQQQKQENEEIDENDDGGGSNVVEDAGREGDVVPLPPPPSVPSSDLFELPDHQSNTPQEPPPPSYDGIELSLSGQPTTTETSSTVEKNTHEEMFIPPPPSSLPPPHSYSQPPPPQNNDPTRTNNVSSSSNNSNNNDGSSGKGMFSSIFHNNSNKSSNNNNNNKKISKEQMGDAIELTKFALAALQNGDGELGRERLEQALAVWR